MTLLQQSKHKLVIDNVKPLMLEKGINNLKISDIAKHIKVGEATLYRYFGTKVNLVIQVGISLWNDIYQEINELKKQETGYQSIKSFYQFFLTGYTRNNKVFVFLDEFDSLMVKEQVSKEQLADYDAELLKVKEVFDAFFNQGLEDQSIKEHIDKDEYYYTSTHMILGVCKRLAGTGHIVLSDDIVQDKAQIQMALEICTQFIKKESENK